MIRRLIKVLAIALGIIFVPYFIGQFTYLVRPFGKESTIIVYWAMGLAMGCLVLGVLTIIFGILYSLYKYIRYGN